MPYLAVIMILMNIYYGKVEISLLINLACQRSYFLNVMVGEQLIFSVLFDGDKVSEFVRS